MESDPLRRNNVNVIGRTDARDTLLFVNGLGADQTIWSQVVPAFARDWRIVLFDHVGSVDSNFEDFRARQSHYLNASGYAEDLLQIVAALGLPQPPVAVGHSIGGLALLLASVRQAEAFARLVLIGTSPRYLDAAGYRGGFTTADIHATYAALDGDYPAWVSAFSRAALGESSPPNLAERFAGTMGRVPKELMLTIVCSVLQTDHRAALPLVRVPVLIAQSSADYFVPRETADYLHAQIPGSRLAIIDAIGHLPHLTAPEALVDGIRAFVEAGEGLAC